MEAVFRSPTPNRLVVIPIPAYADDTNTGIELCGNCKGLHRVGTDYMRCYFCCGKDHNELILTEDADITAMRRWLESDLDIIEVSCDEEAKEIGLGITVGAFGGDHSQHIRDLQARYGAGDDEGTLEDWDRNMRNRIRK